MFGAGVRKDDDYFRVFEKLVNVVHEPTPQARIAFNTGPTDSDLVIQRWAWAGVKLSLKTTNPRA